MKPSHNQWPQIYLCVGLTTMATLLLELSLTRIFSVVFYYHMAFLAAAAVALTNSPPVKVVRRDRRLTDAAPQGRGLRQTKPTSAVPLYYARFSVN